MTCGAFWSRRQRSLGKHVQEGTAAVSAGRGELSATLRVISDSHAHERNALRRFNGIRSCAPAC